jgi:hypothetical protein
MIEKTVVKSVPRNSQPDYKDSHETKEYNPVIEFEFEGRTLQPGDLSIMERAILEVMKEEVIKLGPGNPNGKRIDISARKVMAKLKELQKQQSG